jgi:predicted ATPase
MAAKGWGSPEVGEVYTRAHTLCHQVEEQQQRYQALQGLYRFHVIQAQLRTAGALSQQLFHLASHQPDPVRVLEGHFAVGYVAFIRGDLVTARTHLEHSLHLCYTHLPAPLLVSGGHDARVTTLLRLALALWALGAVDQARWWEAEVYRLKGALLRQLPRPDVGQAEACFQQALHVACRQQAKALELRAALSCSQLWLAQGKWDEARGLLAPLYGWFTEGFDTADLQEARALLEALA